MTALQAVLLSTLFLANLSPVPFCEAVDIPLRFMFLTAFTGDFNSSGTVPAIEIALERINQDPSILPGYQLQTVPVRDSECAELPSQRAFLDQVLFNETILAVIGAGCTAATEPIAEISNYWGLSMISYVSSAVVLSDRSRFQNFFRVYPSEENYIPALVAVVRKFKWNRVGIVTQNAVIFNDNLEIFSQLLREENITVELVSTGSNAVPSLLNRDVDMRVIFLNMYEAEARKFLCQAKITRAGGFGDIKYEYAWLTYGWYTPDWWNVNDTMCTPQVLKSVVTRAIAIQQYPIASNRTATAVGVLSYMDFQELYRQRAGTKFDTAYFGHIAYDSVWTLALALNKTMNMINTNDTLDCGTTPLPLEDFTYNNSTTACLIRRNLESTNFMGLSGQVEFDSNGTRSDATVRILQYRERGANELELVQFASYTDETENATFLPNEDVNTIFTDPVSDGTPIPMVITFHVALVVVLYIAAAAGIVLTIICCLFNTVFKNKKIIRLTSPNLNYFMIAGAFMVYFSVFFRVLPTTNIIAWEFICSVPVWLDFIGYTLAFSTILAKMWRIYYIFHNPAPNKRSLSDWHMAALILLITMVMVIIIVIGFAIPEVRPSPKLMNDTEQPPAPNENGIIVRHFSYSCYRPQATIWLIFLYAFLLLLQIIAVVFALQTRKVKIKALNESKEVAIIIYVASIMIVGIAIVAFTLREYKNISEVFLSGGLITATTVFLLVVFIPKMYRLYKDPTGENVYSTKEAGDTSIEIGKRGTIKLVTDKDRIIDLEKRVVVLQSELENKRASQFHGEAISNEMSPPRSERECQSATDVSTEVIVFDQSDSQSAKFTTDASLSNNCSTVNTTV